MKCEEFWERGAEAADHLLECPVCAALHEREQSVAAALKALGAQQRRTDAPARVERRLLDAFRAEMGVAPVPRRSVWFPALTWAVAAAATAVLALLVMHSRQPDQVRRPARSTVEMASADAPYVIDVSPALRVNGFIPLPNAEQIDPGDEVDVVRMELPRSTLIAMGLAVGEEGTPENVEADVALGSDGVARAVRFLD